MIAQIVTCYGTKDRNPSLFADKKVEMVELDSQIEDAAQIAKSKGNAQKRCLDREATPPQPTPNKRYKTESTTSSPTATMVREMVIDGITASSTAWTPVRPSTSHLVLHNDASNHGRCAHFNDHTVR